MGGGSRLKDGSGKTVETPNLTPHGSAMGSWSEEEFRRAITEGIGKTNEVIAYPMPLYPQLREDEISAMYNYLQSLPSLE